MVKKVILGILFVFVNSICLKAQVLKPGFDAQEYLEILRISARISSDTNRTKLKGPESFQKIYSSNETKLYNKFDVWINASSKIAVLSFRGTVRNKSSWAENFYSSMHPATGEIKYDSSTFTYKLSADSLSKVHLGWLVALSDLSTGFIAQLNMLQNQGYKNLIITGHSQGGAIAFLARAFLHYTTLFDDSKWTIKTYCTAPPKPGNQFFAYDFESYNYGWAYRIINPLDWVPDMPITLQGSNEVNKPNPFFELNKTLKTQSFLTRNGGLFVYNKLNNGVRKAQKRFMKYNNGLSFRVLKEAKSDIPKYKKNYAQYYFPCANGIILKPTNNYIEWSKSQKQDLFLHHMKTPYEFLLFENFPDLKK